MSALRRVMRAFSQAMAGASINVGVVTVSLAKPPKVPGQLVTGHVKVKREGKDMR